MSKGPAWRVEPGMHVDLASIPTHETQGAPGDRAATATATAELTTRLADLQGRLWGEAKRSLLVVLQAMDAGGKDGTVKHVFTGVNPAGVRVVSFKEPSTTELAHDFLWRVHRACPPRGEIGIFNRSHYEDVLITRVNQLVPEAVWRRRYDSIRDFETMLHHEGTTVVKLFLHISRDEQKARFEARLHDPNKNWKFSHTDLEVRSRWGEYQAAYEDAIAETSTELAPWHVIPADHKWFRNWAVSTVLVEALERMDPKYPDPEPGLESVVVD